MLFDEYKKNLEEILLLTEILEKFCNEDNVDDFETPFNKRDKLFQKLSKPENFTKEQMDYILKLRDKIQEKNNFIMQYCSNKKDEIKNQLSNLKQENKIINAYKLPDTNPASSFCNYLE